MQIKYVIILYAQCSGENKMKKQIVMSLVILLVSDVVYASNPTSTGGGAGQRAQRPQQTILLGRARADAARDAEQQRAFLEAYRAHKSQGSAAAQTAVNQPAVAQAPAPSANQQKILSVKTAADLTAMIAKVRAAVGTRGGARLNEFENSLQGTALTDAQAQAEARKLSDLWGTMKKANEIRTDIK
jgi:hypothetical protein